MNKAQAVRRLREQYSGTLSKDDDNDQIFTGGNDVPKTMDRNFSLTRHDPRRFPKHKGKVRDLQIPPDPKLGKNEMVVYLPSI